MTHVDDRNVFVKMASKRSFPLKRMDTMIIHDVDGDERENDTLPKTRESRLCCSHRLFIAFLLGACTFILYAQRQILNMTIYCMIDHRSLETSLLESENSTTSDIHQCARSHSLNSDLMKTKPGPFSWNKDVQATVISSFYWGYCIQFLGGLMATKIGPRISLAMSVLFSSICTLLISFADEFASADYAYVVVLRVLTGLSQSFVYPCALIMVTSWSTRSEKSRMLSFVSAGSSMGIIFATLMSGPMCSTNYWEFNFVVVGLMGLLWLWPWLKFASDSPTRSSTISSQELAYLKKYNESTMATTSSQHAACTSAQDRRNQQLFAPLVWHMLGSRSVWAIVVTNVLSDFTFYGILSVFPAFMAEVYGIDVVLNSYIGGGEYALMWLITVLFACISDAFIKSKRLSVLSTRKLCNSIGMVVPALFFSLIGFLDCSSVVTAIIFLIIGGGFPGAYLSSGFVLSAVDTAGAYSGIVFGLSNSLGALSGIAAPYVAHAITKDSTLVQWRTCFLVFSVVLLLAGLVFAVMGRAELEPWAATGNSTLSPRRRRNRVAPSETAEANQVDYRPMDELEMVVPSGGLASSSSNDSSENLAKRFDKTVVSLRLTSKANGTEMSFDNIEIV